MAARGSDGSRLTRSPAHRHAELVELVDKARFDYFVRDAPTVSDGEYDR